MGTITIHMAADASPTHLVVVHHGYGAGPHSHAEFCAELQAKHPETLVLNSAANCTEGQMKEGVMACGARLAQEIRGLVQDTPSLQSISMVGVSMGGLVSRAAAGMLWSERRVAGLEPSSLCCMASPMLGIRKTLPWVARMALWLFGSGQSPTMADMMLEGNELTGCGSGTGTTLETLTTGDYMNALTAFNRRVVAGATHGDPLCPYSTAMLVGHSPTSEPSDLNHTRMVGGHIDPAGHIPTLECQAAEQFEDGSIEHQMLTRLRSLSWERYELYVAMEDRSRFLGAHNDRALEEAHRLLLDTVKVGDKRSL